MATKYESDFIKINIDTDKDYIEAIRKLKTAFMTEEDYKRDVVDWIKIIETNKSKYQLVDDRDMKFIIAPEFQTWINENLVAPAVKAGLKKVAFLESPEIFAQVSVEQLMDDRKDTILKVQYFEDEDKAKNWLLTE